MRILDNTERINATCHFCGKSQSVRYAVTTLVDGKQIEVKCCNRCVLMHMNGGKDNETHDAQE